MIERYIPTLESVLLKEEKENIDGSKKKLMVMELLASIQPLIFFQHGPESPLSVENVLKFAPPGSALWQKIIVSSL